MAVLIEVDLRLPEGQRLTSRSKTHRRHPDFGVEMDGSFNIPAREDKVSDCVNGDASRIDQSRKYEDRKYNRWATLAWLVGGIG